MTHFLWPLTFYPNYICVFFLGPWGQDFPECNGDQQSPIDFKNVPSPPAGFIPPLEFSAGYLDTLVGHLVNDGHTGKIRRLY